MSDVRIPDGDLLMLDALRNEIDRLHETKVIDTETLQYLFEQEPESHVFTCDDITEEDYEESFATIKEVGSRDVNAKIDYWLLALQRIAGKEES